VIRRLAFSGVALVVIAAAVGAYTIFRPGSGTREVVIPRGATTAEIGRILEREGVIGSDSLFGISVRLRNLEGKLQAGRYELREGMGMLSALNLLAQGPQEKGTGVTVPEGFSLRLIAERVGARTHIGRDQFLRAAQGGAGVRASIQPPGVQTLEGFLYPDTYFVGDNESAAVLTKRMVQAFERRIDGLDWSGAESRKLTKYQALIVASLVEREAKVDEDRAKVAAVIYNRLAKGMRLQIDITALYGLDEHKVPTRADLRRPSPYNTYLIDGLPPTPIASPGLASIQATLHPAPIDAIYYVVIDPSGKHGFTSDPQEFERLKQRRPAEVH
jgi:UPF0755 protein